MQLSKFPLREDEEKLIAQSRSPSFHVGQKGKRRISTSATLEVRLLLYYSCEKTDFYGFCSLAPASRFSYICVIRVCGRNSVVECQLPKLDVAGSSPVARSTTHFLIRNSLFSVRNSSSSAQLRCSDPATLNEPLSGILKMTMGLASQVRRGANPSHLGSSSPVARSKNKTS